MIVFYIFQANFLINSVITFDLLKVQKNQTPFWKRKNQENFVEGVKSHRSVFFTIANHAALLWLFSRCLGVCVGRAEHKLSSRDGTNARKEPFVNDIFFS